MGESSEERPPASNEAVAVMGLFSLSSKEQEAKAKEAQDGAKEAQGAAKEAGCGSDGATASASSSGSGSVHVPNTEKTNQEKEASTPSDKVVDSKPGPTLIPRTNDILSGRGNGANQHTGNIYFRNLIASYKRKYVLSEPVIKKQITHQVLAVIESRKPPGRFLKQESDTGQWHELDRDTALRKTAQALREKAPQLKKKVLEEAEHKDMIVESLKRKKFDTSSGEKKFRAGMIPADMHSMKSLNDLKASLARGGQANDLLFHPQLQPFQQASLAVPGLLQNVPTMFSPQQHQAHLNLVSVPNPSVILSPNGDLLQNHGITSQAAYNEMSFARPQQTVSNDSSQAQGATLLNALPQDQQANSSGFMPFTFNYKYLTLASHAKVSSESDETSKRGKAKVAGGITIEKSTEMLENIIVVASNSCDLTALYLIVSMSAQAFSSPLFSRNTIKPENHDVLINASQIQNHPGNLNLAESIQSYRGDYLQSGYSNQMKDDIVQLVLSNVTKEVASSANGSKKKGRFLICIEGKKKNSLTWKVLPGVEISSMIKSLFEQACAFILNPDPNDVLFGSDDRSRLSSGNIFFKSIVRRCKPLFLQSPPEKKMQYATEIVGFVTSRPGRFLGYIENMGMWIPLPFESAIEHTQEHLDTSTGEDVQAIGQSIVRNTSTPIAHAQPPTEIIQGQTPFQHNYAAFPQGAQLHAIAANHQLATLAASNLGGLSPMAIQGALRNGLTYR